MSMTRSGFRRPIAAILSLLLLATGMISIGSTGIAVQSASAEQATIPVTVTATPTTGLVDGSQIAINVDASESQIFQVVARLCKASATIDLPADFNPTQGGNCIKTVFPGSLAPAPSASVSTAPPNKSASLNYRIGVGTQTFATQELGDTTVACGPIAPACKLVLALSVPDGIVYKSFPLTFQGQAFTPGAPTAVKAAAPSPATGKALVSWTAPSSSGGVPISSYSVTSSPGDFTCTAVTSAGCTVAGLTDGTPYTFTVKATNESTLTSEASAASAAFIPGGTRFTQVTPATALNTSATTPKTPIGTLMPRDLKIAGLFGVPADATAVVLNVTAVAPTAAGSLTVYPKGTSKPATKNLDFAIGATVSNVVTVGLGTGAVANAGRVLIANSAGSTNVIVDVVGYYKADVGSYLTMVSPARVVNTSATTPKTPIGAIMPRDLKIAGLYGVPANATSVVLNVTALAPTAAGSLTVYPKGTIKPATKNINFARGMTISNTVIVRLGTGAVANAGYISIANSAGSTNVTVDVVGYFSPSATGSRYFTRTAVRTFDTATGTGGALAKIGAGATVKLTIAGRSGIPSTGVKAILMNVSASGRSAAGGITVSAAGSTKPGMMQVYGAANTTRSNLVVSALGETPGKVSIFNTAGTTNVMADLAGYFA